MKYAALWSRARHWWRKELRSLLVLAVVIFAIRSSLADWNDVPTGSMKPTILVGDRVIVNKLAYDMKVPFTTWRLAQWSNPQRGDIVVFYSPRDGQRLVKRVIGLPGDTVELSGNRLLLNGQPVSYGPLEHNLPDLSVSDLSSQEFALEQLPGRTHMVASIPGRPAARDFGPQTVPPGQYFMMGDNRDDSLDSRFFGAVPRGRILGKATAVALSVDRENLWVPRWGRSFSSLQ